MKAIHIVIASAIITATAIRAAPALAEPAAGEGEIAISYVQTADLDLRSDSGRRQLDRRIVVAAREVCGTASDADLEGKNAVRHCVDEVVAKARGESEQLIASANRGVIAVTAAR